jgi:hypothetical protein
MAILLVNGKPIVPPGMALRLTRIGRSQFGEVDDLAAFVPERATHVFALHPDNWARTFWDLTNKDSSKLNFYWPVLIEMREKTLVAEMRYASEFAWHSRERDAIAYRSSVRELSGANIAEYEAPELLIPRGEEQP